MDIEKICRTCLGLSGPLLSIYDGGGSGGGCIADMLRDFTKSKPRMEDKLPDRVCLSCISEINRCYSFKLKCENSCRTLRQLLPDALPEESDEPPVTVKVVQHDKSVQTQPKLTNATASVCTQTIDKMALERTDQQSQTNLIVASSTMRHVTTSPIIFEEVKPQGTVDIKIENTAIGKRRGEVLEIRATKKLLLENQQLSLAHNNHNSYDDYEHSDTEANAILMEYDADETEVRAKVHEMTSYGSLRVVQQENEPGENAITHYKLMTEQTEGETAQKKSGLKINEAGEPLREGDIGYADEENYAHFTYNEENDEGFIIEEGNATAQKVDYNFTIVSKSTNAEEEEVEAVAETRANQKKAPPIKKELECNFCSMTFVSAKRLAWHEGKYHGEEIRSAKALKGEEISIDLDEEPDLEVSIVNEESKTVINSNITEKTATSELMKQPIVQETKPGELVHFCECCGAGFARLRSLIQHTKQDVCAKPVHKCKKCGRVFISAELLNEHKFRHMQEFACTECEISFATNDGLAQHMIKIHKRKLRNQCGECKKVFTILSALKDHLRVHSGEKPFVCEICKKAFSQKTNLKQHVARHSQDKKFKCPDCPMSFVTKAELGSHRRTHTGEHPYRCDECQATFTISSSLVKHKRIHTGERPYACDLCPKRFTSSFTLKNHRRVHTGEKPFKCRYCDKAFTQKQDCIIHHRTHTGERNHVCHCGEKFTHLGTLRTHQKIHENPRNTKRVPPKLDITIMDVDVDEEGVEEEEEEDVEKATVLTVECEEEAVSEEKLMELAIEGV